MKKGNTATTAASGKKMVRTKPLPHHDYRGYINSSEWIKQKQKVYLRDKKQCVICGKRYNLAIHHETYKHLGMPEEINDCITLCKDHHKGIHNTIKYLKKCKKVIK
jgi:5-methylcytosine-specific restriction endonuclease McrA